MPFDETNRDVVALEPTWRTTLRPGKTERPDCLCGSFRPPAEGARLRPFVGSFAERRHLRPLRRAQQPMQY